MSGPDKIKQPKDVELEKKFNKAVKMRGRLVWSPYFGYAWSGQFKKAQNSVDTEVLGYGEKYAPKRNTVLIKSGDIATKVGSGEVRYHTPYARYQYYGKLMVDPDTGSSWARAGVKKVLTQRDLTYEESPPRGAFWFETIKEMHKDEILKGAKKIVKLRK